MSVERPATPLALAPTPPPRAAAVTPLDAERVRLNITVPRRLLAKLEVATDALGHVFPDARAGRVTS